jgi:hypothetical protein
MAGDGRTGEFDNVGDVNIEHQLFVLVVFDAGSADTDDGDLPSYFFLPSLSPRWMASHQMSITILCGRLSRPIGLYS